MRIHHISISVRDSKKSASFYIENFGFKEVERFTKPHWDGDAIILELGNIKLEIFGFKNYIEKKDDLSELNVIGLKHSIQKDHLFFQYNF
jgi:catechol 2,3-dioxygenase-like lactoylglutathione lyase family enzyme